LLHLLLAKITQGLVSSFLTTSFSVSAPTSVF